MTKLSFRAAQVCLIALALSVAPACGDDDDNHTRDAGDAGNDRDAGYIDAGDAGGGFDAGDASDAFDAGDASDAGDAGDAGDASAALDAGDAGNADDGGDDDGGVDEGRDGPAGNQVNLHPHQRGTAADGKAIFRTKTFGNERFWTDAVKLPQGIADAMLTPLQAIAAGFSVNTEALDQTTLNAIAAELQTDLTPANAPLLNDSATTIALINANAVIGVVAKDTNDNGTINIAAGDKVGVACALCHAITDGSVLNMPNGGSIGIEVDGPTPHFLNLGAAFALAANSRALYPLAQLALEANDGHTIGRAPNGLTEESTEAEVDAYFSNPDFYPIGMFDDQPDGNGAPMHITPMFRSDLSAPYGSEGAISQLDHFSNLVYTVLFDLRSLNTAGGRAFMHTLGGEAGDEIVNDYVAILTETGVPTEPAINTATTGAPGEEATPVGVRVDNDALLDLNAYMDSLEAPAGTPGDAAAIARATAMFRTQCTSCHNLDQGRFVPSMIVPMADIFPGDNPVQLAEREPPLNPILNTINSIFDDKMAVVNASLRGDIRGIALPLLLDLERKPVFLHDNSVPSLNALFNPVRGQSDPHPFYIGDAGKRADMIQLLHSFDTE